MVLWYLESDHFQWCKMLYIILVIADYWVYFRPVAVTNVTSFSSACYFRFDTHTFTFIKERLLFLQILNLYKVQFAESSSETTAWLFTLLCIQERQRNYGGWQGTKWMLLRLLLLHFSVLSISNHPLCFHLAHSYSLWDKKLYFNKWQKLTCTYLFGWNLFYVQFQTFVRLYGICHAKF